MQGWAGRKRQDCKAGSHFSVPTFIVPEGLWAGTVTPWSCSRLCIGYSPMMVTWPGLRSPSRNHSPVNVNPGLKQLVPGLGMQGTLG